MRGREGERHSKGLSVTTWGGVEGMNDRKTHVLLLSVSVIGSYSGVSVIKRLLPLSVLSCIAKQVLICGCCVKNPKGREGVGGGCVRCQEWKGDNDGGE